MATPDVLRSSSDSLRSSTSSLRCSTDSLTPPLEKKNLSEIFYSKATFPSLSEDNIQSLQSLNLESDCKHVFVICKQLVRLR